MKSLVIGLLVISFFTTTVFSQVTSRILYKKVDTTSLYMDVLYPGKDLFPSPRPAIVFFFGGGWVTGTMQQFINQAKYLTERGLVCFLVDYRVKSRQGTTPFESLKDAKSSIRYIRSHAKELGIIPDSIVASGGSAGGHLAAATALIKDYNESTDDESVSCVPNALVLFNPVIDNGPGGYGYERIGEQYKKFSPLHNIQKGAPPTILFIGSHDKLIPVATVKNYEAEMENVGSRCELHIYEGMEHGFFNKPLYMANTLQLTDVFLASLGYISGKPLLDRIDYYKDLKKPEPGKL